MNGSKRPPLDELVSIYQALIAAEGVTTGAGAAAGNSFIDAALVGAGADSYIGMTAILYPGDPNAVDSAIITGFNNGTGEVTLAEAYKGVAAAIPIGVNYKIINLKAISATALALLVSIFNLVNAVLVASETGGTVTATAPGTEDDVYINNAPAGVFKPILVTIDTSDLAAGETVTFRTRYQIAPGGALELKGAPVIFAGVQAEPLKDIVLQPNRYGIQVTLDGTTGVVFPWEVFYDV